MSFTRAPSAGNNGEGVAKLVADTVNDRWLVTAELFAISYTVTLHEYEPSTRVSGCMLLWMS